MSIVSKRIAFFALFFWMPLIVSAQEGETIMVSHQAEIDQSDVLASKKKTYNDTLVKSLLMASQSVASPTILQKNSGLLKEKFSENPKSFIRDYQFVEQKTQGNVYVLKLKVEPKWYYLKNKLTDWGFLGFQSSPTLRIQPFIVDQNVDHKITVSGEYWSAKVSQHINNVGVRALPTEVAVASPSTGYVVQGKIIRSAGSQAEFAFLVSDQKTQKKHQFLITLDKKIGEEKISGLISLMLIENIMPIWFESQGNQRIYEVRLQNVQQFALQQEFKKVMQSKRGIVQDIVDKKYSKGSTTFQVKVLQETLNFASFLSSLTVSGKNIQVVEQKGRLIAIELQ